MENNELARVKEEKPLLGRVAQLSNSAFYIQFNGW